MTKLETLHACARAEASSLFAEQADDLDDEPRRDDALDLVLKEESQKSGELDDALLEAEPEYGDLLDVDWLERGADSVDMEEEVIDVGLTLDLDERDELEDAGLAIEFDVGSLLTLLPQEALPSELPPAEVSPSGVLPARALPSDGSFGATTIDELLLPEGVELGLDRGDEEVGDDENFPAFDDDLVPSVPPAEDEDAPNDAGAEG